MTRALWTALTVLMVLCCNGSGQPRRIQLGYANVQTVKRSPAPGDLQHMYPGIVVRMFPVRGRGESFAVSNRDGIVVVPLRPGQYCFEAFDGNGVQLVLDAKQANCFSIHLDKTTDIGVVVRFDQ